MSVLLPAKRLSDCVAATPASSIPVIAGAPAAPPVQMPAAVGPTASAPAMTSTANTGQPALTLGAGGAASVPAVPASASPPPPTAAPAAAGGITYQKDVRPIVEARCVGCHVQGGSAPFPLTSWADIDPYKELMVQAVKDRKMPPWLADASQCTKLRYDQRLTDDQLAAFTGWQAAGFPQGDAAEFEPIAEETQPDLGAPTIVSKSTVPYQLKPNTEEYVCLQLDASFPQDVYIIGMDLAAEHPQYVHHAIVSEGSGECDALGVTAPNIFSYRPGSRTLAFEKGDGLLVRANSRLAIQYHYNTTGHTDVPTDQSAFRIWTMPAGQKPDRIITRYPHHSFAISIPVGAVDQKVTDTVGMDGASAPNGTGFVAGEIIGVSPHMHALGQQFSETLTHADGTSTCLVTVPDWDFNWQIDYFFDPKSVIPVAATDSMTQNCIYSNRPQDQMIEDGMQLAPKFTTFGEGTRDEMCLGYVWFRYKASDYR